MTHDLKTWPEYFAAVLDGSKTFELRSNDRGFSVGDLLRLREWDPETSAYTGREVTRSVSYLLPGPDFGPPTGFAGPVFGLMVGFVIMGLVPSGHCPHLHVSTCSRPAGHAGSHEP